ncbi:hypothetical protein GQX73_g2221 [Xylaria multiplex]|uniref:Aminoglycoside phosphotransferase domain-containing protein n=1 Tax=Xylaria multiplex TaxID=323545 RepID=A0A7C8IUG8_9PEZI|nr:hypothetical protein GQX73_g2221 [Xylaria multiplex]
MFRRGSYNVNLVVENRETTKKALFRVPNRGYIPGEFAEKKVKGEVMTLKRLGDRTNISVPSVHCWGPAKEGPHKMTSFLVEEWMPGESLEGFLRNPQTSKEKLMYVFEQLARIMLELSCQEFNSIGSFSKDDKTGDWAVTGSVLIPEMIDTRAYFDIPIGHFKAMDQFKISTDYFKHYAEYLEELLETQVRSGCEGLENDGTTERQRNARRGYAKLIPEYAKDDSGPFVLYCSDLRPNNILFDPETMEITALIDLEFTNAMPAQFAYDLPWWLLCERPADVIIDHGMEEFLKRFNPRKEMFLEAMERVKERDPMALTEPRLSARMRYSYDGSKIFWWNRISESSRDFDTLYYEIFGNGE